MKKLNMTVKCKLATTKLINNVCTHHMCAKFEAAITKNSAFMTGYRHTHTHDNL